MFCCTETSKQLCSFFAPHNECICVQQKQNPFISFNIAGAHATFCGVCSELQEVYNIDFEVGPSVSHQLFALHYNTEVFLLTYYSLFPFNFLDSDSLR